MWFLWRTTSDNYQSSRFEKLNTPDTRFDLSEKIQNLRGDQAFGYGHLKVEHLFFKHKVVKMNPLV